MDDLISRQAAIDALKICDNNEDGINCYKCPLRDERWNGAWRNDETNCYRKLMRDSAELLSAQPEQRWIPCSERLPEKEGWYITTVESEKTGKRRIENDLFAVDIALAHGHTPNKFCKDGYRQRTVAWMPFPEPYCGGK